MKQELQLTLTNTVAANKGKGRILLWRYLQRQASLYNRRKWQLIGKSQWSGSANAAARTHTTAPINHTRPSPHKLPPNGAAHARKHVRLQLTTHFIDLERMKG